FLVNIFSRFSPCCAPYERLMSFCRGPGAVWAASGCPQRAPRPPARRPPGVEALECAFDTTGMTHMTISLSKGSNLDITKAAGGTLTKVLIGVGWEARKGDGPAFDLDASIIGLGDNGLSVGEDWFIFYNRLTPPRGTYGAQ